MRNIFDQYEQSENRLTHALVSSLDADRRMLVDFLHWIGEGSKGKKSLSVHQQSFPGTEEVEPEEGERRGIPDGCVADGTGWALLIESKLENRWNASQLRRHRETATRHGLTDCRILCLIVGKSKQAVPAGCIVRSWSDVYAWLGRHTARSDWAQRCRQYFEIAETQLVAGNRLSGGAITVFTGIPFGDKEPYNYFQAKRLLGLLRARLIEDPELRKGLDIDHQGVGRGAITGTKGRAVWDYIGLMSAREAVSFTKYPHLTLGIHDDRLVATLTVPNSVPPARRRRLLGDGFEAFKTRIGPVVEGIAGVSQKAPGIRPVIIVVQRHYRSQRSEPVRDAMLHFDPRTAIPVKRGEDSAVKRQPEWLELAYRAVADRRSNMQFQVGAEFTYAACDRVRSAGIADAVAAVWLACAPLLVELSLE